MVYRNGLPDTREDKRTNDLLNTQRVKTRSGHVLEMNDNQGVEHITLQHRSGAMMQLQPDGSVRFVSQNGQMGFEIKGDGYVDVTGVYYIHAKTGDIHIDEDLRLKVGGNMDVMVGGNYTVTALNITETATGLMSISAHDYKLATADTTTFTCGNYTKIGTDNMMLIKSYDASIFIHAQEEIWQDSDKITDTATRIDHN